MANGSPHIASRQNRNKRIRLSGSKARLVADTQTKGVNSQPKGVKSPAQGVTSPTKGVTTPTKGVHSRPHRRQRGALQRPRPHPPIQSLRYRLHWPATSIFSATRPGPA
eukprot:171185-Prorocentrum_minimum.AAC.1